MIELRDKEVAQEQVVAGSADPREMGERMIGWVTPYQRAFAKYPLTLHAADLPSNIVAGCAMLDAHVEEILSHAPALLPSHRNHPQWNYHLGPFMEARHLHLSSRLGSATESERAPTSLIPIDRVWWKLDGLKKRHERRRADLVRARERHMELLQEQVTQVSKAAEAQRREMSKRFFEEYSAAAEMEELTEETDPQLATLFFESRLDSPCKTASADRDDLPSSLLEKYRQQFAISEARLDKKIAQLHKALHAVYLDYERQLLLADQAAKVERDTLEHSYRQLIQKDVTSALVPQVRILRDGDPRPGEQRLRNPIYWLSVRFSPAAQLVSHLRHVREASASAGAKGMCNVLVIGDRASVIDLAVPRFRGVRASVTSAGVRSGNLAMALDAALMFDLCAWELTSDELLAFPGLISAIGFCMKPGATIVGLHLNERGAVLPVHALNAPQEVALETFVEKLPRPVEILNRTRRFIAAHGLSDALKLLLKHLASSAWTSLRKTVTSSAKVGVHAEHSGVRTVITVVARLPSGAGPAARTPLGSSMITRRRASDQPSIHRGERDSEPADQACASAPVIGPATPRSAAPDALPPRQSELS